MVLATVPGPAQLREQQQYGCPLCPKSYSLRKSMVDHCLRVHKQSVKDIGLNHQHQLNGYAEKKQTTEMGGAGKGAIKCYECPRSFKSKDRRDRHFIRKHTKYQIQWKEAKGDQQQQNVSEPPKKKSKKKLTKTVPVTPTATSATPRATPATPVATPATPMATSTQEPPQKKRRLDGTKQSTPSGPPIKCPICRKPYKGRIGIRKHIQLKHPDIPDEEGKAMVGKLIANIASQTDQAQATPKAQATSKAQVTPKAPSVAAPAINTSSTKSPKTKKPKKKKLSTPVATPTKQAPPPVTPSAQSNQMVYEEMVKRVLACLPPPPPTATP